MPNARTAQLAGDGPKSGKMEDDGPQKERPRHIRPYTHIQASCDTSTPIIFCYLRCCFR